MATKPTETINFEPTGDAVVAIPSGKQAAGWRPGERPPAQYRNWLDRTVSRLYNYVLDGALSGNHTIAGTLGVTGNVTAPDFRHGDRETVVPAPSFFITTNALGVPALTDDWSGFGSPPNDFVRAPLALRSGDRIKSVTWHINKGGSSSLMICKLRVRNGTTNTDVDTLSDSASGGSYTSVTRTLGTPYVVAAGDAITLVVQGTNSAHRLSHAVIVYDRP